MNAQELMLTHADGFIYFPAYAWPGGYAIGYLDKFNEVLCASCATVEYEKAMWEDVAFPPIAAFIEYGEYSVLCSECNKRIE